MSYHTHGGDVYRNKNVIDFSANCNPFGTPKSVKEAAVQAMEEVFHYPDTDCQELREAIGVYEEVRPEWIICGNGAADLIYRLVLGTKPKQAVLFAPTFAEYEQALEIVNCEVKHYELKEENGFCVEETLLDWITEKTDIVFLCNPNNPTGQTIDRDMLIKILDCCKKQNIVVILDECFLEFLDEPNRYEMSNLRGEYPNLLIIKAFTKIFSMPGLRLGYAISSNPDILEEMSWKLQQWNVSVPAQMAGVAALENPKEYIRQTREYVSGQREYMRNIMKMMGYVVFASKANYLFFKGRPGLEKEALEAGFLIRDCQNYEGLSEGFYRIAVRTKEENERLITWLGRL